jgi:hypothetical protein
MKKRAAVRGRDGIRRCLVCGRNIEERGRAAKFCEEHARANSLRWRRLYDAMPQMIAKRKKYDARPENMTRAKFRRNKKMFLLSLFFELNGLKGLSIDQAIRRVEEKLKERGKKPTAAPPQLGLAPEPKGNWPYPWKTARGRPPKKKGGRAPTAVR